MADIKLNMQELEGAILTCRTSTDSIPHSEIVKPETSSTSSALNAFVEEVNSIKSAVVRYKTATRNDMTDLSNLGNSLMDADEAASQNFLAK